MAAFAENHSDLVAKLKDLDVRCHGLEATELLEGSSAGTLS